MIDAETDTSTGTRSRLIRRVVKAVEASTGRAWCRCRAARRSTGSIGRARHRAAHVRLGGDPPADREPAAGHVHPDARGPAGRAGSGRLHPDRRAGAAGQRGAGAGGPDHRGRRRDPHHLRGGAPAGRARRRSTRRCCSPGCWFPSRCGRAGPTALRMSASRLPHARLLDIDTRMEAAAARPVIVPDTIVIDGGKVFVSDTFTRACERLGISVQRARPATPTDKAIVEATFCVDQHPVLPARGRIHRLERHAARHRRDRRVDVPELQDLLDEWLLAGWQPRPHDALRDPLAPRRALSPNEKYAALVAAAGYLPLTLSGEDYLELLPVAMAPDQRLRHPHRLPHLRLRRAGAVAAAALRCHRPARALGSASRPLRRHPRVRPHPGRVGHRAVDSPADGLRAVRRVHLAPRPPPGRRDRKRRHQRNRDRPDPRRPAHPRAGRAGEASATTGSPPAPGSPQPRTGHHRETTPRLPKKHRNRIPPQLQRHPSAVRRNETAAAPRDLQVRWRGCRYPASHRRFAVTIGSGAPSNRYSQPTSSHACRVISNFATSLGLRRSSGRQSTTTAESVHSANEVVRCMRPISSAALGAPATTKTAARRCAHRRVEVQRHHMIAFQPRLESDMAPVGGRPPQPVRCRCPV